MRSRHKQTQRTIAAGSVLLVSLVGLIVFLQWSDRQDHLTGDIQEDSSQSLHAIGIQRPGFADMRLALIDSQWQIQEPCLADVNPQRMQAFSSLQKPASHSYAAAEVDLLAAGLIEPLATVSLNDTTLHIGNTDLSGERRYIQRNDRIEFAPEWILSLLQGGTSAFAHLIVFPDAMTSLSIQQADGAAVDIADHIMQWQTLSANQVISWPMKDDEPELRQTYTLAYESPSKNGQLRVNVYDAFSAVLHSDAHCAYVVSNDALPTP